MIGGGPGAFIGPVHRIAAELDREIELVAGVFSSDAARSRQAGEAYRIDPARAYGDLADMLAAETSRADGIDFLAIVSPNHNHLPSARAALAAGVPVMSDKPLTATLAEAQELAGLVRAARLPFGVTYTYSGYPLVREARARVAAGALGTVRKVVVEYPQGWLAGEAVGKQAEWRVDPARSGLGGCIGDIGVHAADAVLGGGLVVYGDAGGLVGRQETPNTLTLHGTDGRTEIIHAGGPQLGADAAARTRTPTGHPEGYLEAFANLYRDFAAVLRGEPAPLLPGIDAGLRGMAFIATAVAASRDGQGWVDLDC